MPRRAALTLWALKVGRSEDGKGAPLMAGGVGTLRRAPSPAVQALYQMDVTGEGAPPTILAEFETYWIGGEIEGERYNPPKSPSSATF